MSGHLKFFIFVFFFHTRPILFLLFFSWMILLGFDSFILYVFLKQSFFYYELISNFLLNVLCRAVSHDAALGFGPFKQLKKLDRLAVLGSNLDRLCCPETLSLRCDGVLCYANKRGNCRQSGGLCCKHCLTSGAKKILKNVR